MLPLWREGLWLASNDVMDELGGSAPTGLVCPGASVLSRGLAALKALDLSRWQVATPRIAGSDRRQGCSKPFLTASLQCKITKEA